MSKRARHLNNLVRVELLRARAAVERETLAQDLASFSQSLSPSQLFKRWVPKVGMVEGSRLAWQLFTGLRRYPVVLSTLSTFFLQGKWAKRLKLVVGVIAVWQIYRVWRARQT